MRLRTEKKRRKGQADFAAFKIRRVRANSLLDEHGDRLEGRMCEVDRDDAADVNDRLSF